MASLPPLSAPVWERLATGKISHKFSLFAANMAVSQAARALSANPEHKSAVISELRQFFEKYERLTANELTF